MKIKGAIFDMDGTLIDSMPVWANLGSDYLRQMGITPTDDLGKTIKTMTLMECAHYFRQAHGVTHSPEEIIAGFTRMMARQYEKEIPLKPQVRPFLEKLRDAGVRCCVLTANEKHLAAVCLERLNVLSYFDFVLTCTELGLGKEDPALFIKTAELLGTIKEETMVFEDALHAAEAAKKAGLLVTGVYDPSGAKDEQAMRAIADCYVYAFDTWEEK
jgi:HAD superfamily hydrolase (TIGR01509 family)